ncbi:MAG: hypothetical protein ACOX1U_10415 [Saccharofermentanales bacterium]
MIKKIVRLVGLTLIVAIALAAAMIPESRLAFQLTGKISCCSDRSH